ncbi:MAG: hypothetical protein M3539_01085, partial [Acidobacteriota bacterium]|nr:hypothetical protein [Acidobacteriota bacterium]
MRLEFARLERADNQIILPEPVCQLRPVEAKRRPPDHAPFVQKNNNLLHPSGMPTAFTCFRWSSTTGYFLSARRAEIAISSSVLHAIDWWRASSWPP